MSAKNLTDASVATQWWVYMIQTNSGKLYTGITTDIERRFKEHCTVNDSEFKLAAGSKGAKFFRSDPANKIVFREPCDGRSGASQREAAIKKLSRKMKLQLIGGLEMYEQ